MTDLFVGRQPICNSTLAVAAYELLYRSGVTATAGVVDGDNASAVVAINALVEIGLDNLVGDRSAFLNVTRNFMVDGHYKTLPPTRVVLEILEDIVPDDEIIAAVREAKKLGFHIALDDFVGTDGAGGGDMQPLIRMADVIKVDALQLDREQLKEQVRLHKRPDLKLLAEKVETYDDFEYCRDIGYELFQGFFFCQPKIIRRKGIPANRALLVELLTRIQDPSTDFDAIEELIERNVSLSYKLIRYVNSALYALPRKIESIHHAVVMLGLERVRTCVTLLLMSAVDDKPKELLMTALVRARHCQLLGEQLTGKPDHVYFTVGLLSVVDALVDMPMTELLQAVPLSDEIKHAILGHEGTPGMALQGAIYCEQGDFEGLFALDLEADTLQRCYVEALSWALESQAALAAT